MAGDDDNFLARWSRRKTQVARGEPPSPEPAALPPAAPQAAAAADAMAPAPPIVADAEAEIVENPDPPPTLQDAQALTPQADFSRFVKRDVDSGVRNTALKKLFADPHYNVMDGLDIYTGDFHTPDPLPPSMLRQMVQSRLLGLFDDEPATTAAPTAAPATDTPAAPTADAAAAATAPPAQALPDEDPDLRLQPHDAAGRAEPVPGAGEDPGRQP